MPLEGLKRNLHRAERIADLVRDERREARQVLRAQRRVRLLVAGGEIAHQCDGASVHPAQQQLRRERLASANHRPLLGRGHVRADRGEVPGGPLAAGEQRAGGPSDELPRLGEQHLLRVAGGEDDPRGGALVPGDDAGVGRRSHGASQLLADLLDLPHAHASNYPQAPMRPPLVRPNVRSPTDAPVLFWRYADD